MLNASEILHERQGLLPYLSSMRNSEGGSDGPPQELDEWGSFLSMDHDFTRDTYGWEQAPPYSFSVEEIQKYSETGLFRSDLSSTWGLQDYEESSGVDKVLEERGQGTPDLWYITGEKLFKEREDERASGTDNGRGFSSYFSRGIALPSIDAQEKDRGVPVSDKETQVREQQGEVVRRDPVQDLRNYPQCRMWLVGEQYLPGKGFQVSTACCICPSKHEQDFPGQYTREAPSDLLCPTDGAVRS